MYTFKYTLVRFNECDIYSTNNNSQSIKYFTMLL